MSTASGRSVSLEADFLRGAGAARGVFFAAAGLVMLAALLGGGTRQGLWSDAFVQLASLLLLAQLAWSHSLRRLKRADRFLLALLATIFILPLLQLIALPPFLWELLPGRDLFAAAYQEALGSTPWQPISLDPGATLRAWLALIPPLAVFVATLQLDYRERRHLSLLFIALGMLSFLLGLAQLMQGPSSPLRFFPITNPSESVGFFANRNHYAILLAALIPYAAAWAQRVLAREDRNRLYWIALWLIVFSCLLLGIGMARSRAGLLLAGFAVLASLALAGGGQRLPQSRRALAAAIGIGIILIVHFAFFRLSARFEADPLEDYRLTMAKVTLEALWAFFPIGSGFGSFEAAYRIFEPTDVLSTFYVNHAHNDWLELILEGGLPALLILLAALIWLGMRMASLWRPQPDDHHPLDHALQHAAAIAIVILLLHSTVDYPLRTTAISVLFAWCAAMLIPPMPSETRPERRSRPAPHTSATSKRPHRHHRRHSTWRR